MKNKFWDKLKENIVKLKKSKNFYVFVAIGLAVLIGIIYFTSFLPTNDVSSTKENEVTQETSTSEKYARKLESQIENAIMQIQGTGDVDVLITLEKGFEYVYLTEEETKTSASGITTTTTSTVLVNGQPVLVEEIYPVIKGIVVVCSGAGDVALKMNIISLIQTIVDVNSANISIYTSK